MYKLSRRDFFYLSAYLSLLFPLPAYPINEENKGPRVDYPNTILILKNAFKAEMSAYKHYLGYIEKALAEEYPNIAYMFYSFSSSEKIHADNYKRIISKLGDQIKEVLVPIDVSDTKSNLQKAAEKELEKIEKFYPELLTKLKSESCEEAIINCMYSWKSHRQHTKKMKQLQKYSGFFFGKVSSRIEGMNFDFHVCEICGSTIDEEPKSPCELCNRSMSHYKKINRPA
jgi:rubrerythrin